MSVSTKRNLPSKSLVLIMGVAGVGKTTLSKAILRKLSLTYLDNNFIADPFFSETRSSAEYTALRRYFYEVLYRITSENLLVGNSVLLDVPHITHVQDPAWCLRISQMAEDAEAKLIVIRCLL
jgi:predicted kinase